MSFYLQEMKSREQPDDDSVNLKISAGVIYKNALYFSESNINGLFRMDLETEQVECLGMFKKESQHLLLFRSAYLYENEAWFIPWRSSYIVRVNLDLLTMEYYNIPFHTVLSREQQELTTADFTVGLPAYVTSKVVQGRYIFLVPTLYDAVLVIDMKEGTLHPYYDIVDTEKECFAYGCVVGSELWMCPYNGVRLIKLNLKTGKKECYAWDYPARTFAGMEYANGKLWFSPNKADYVLKMAPDMRYKERLLLPSHLKKEICHGIIKYEERLWLIPSKVRGLVSIDYNTEKMETWRATAPDMPRGFRGVFCQNQFLLASGGCILLWVPSQSSFRVFYLRMSRKKLLDQLFEELKENGNPLDFFTDKQGIILEEFITLDRYLKCIDSSLEQRKTGNCGEGIWHRLQEDFGLKACLRNRSII